MQYTVVISFEPLDSATGSAMADIVVVGACNMDLTRCGGFIALVLFFEAVVWLAEHRLNLFMQQQLCGAAATARRDAPRPRIQGQLRDYDPGI